MQHTEPFVIIRNYRQAQLQKGKKAKKRQKAQHRMEDQDQEISSGISQPRKSMGISKRKTLPKVPVIEKSNAPAEQQALEEPKALLLPPFDPENDPFIERRSNAQQNAQPCKIDHQDSMMTEDQIRQVNSYFTF